MHHLLQGLGDLIDICLVYGLVSLIGIRNRKLCGSILHGNGFCGKRISGADGNMDFTVNYDMDAVEAIEGVMGSIQDIAVWFGGTDGTAGADPTPTGELGKFGGKGKISYTISGKGVNEVREIVVHVTPTSAWARITA